MSWFRRELEYALYVSGVSYIERDVDEFLDLLGDPEVFYNGVASVTNEPYNHIVDLYFTYARGGPVALIERITGA